MMLGNLWYRFSMWRKGYKRIKGAVRGQLYHPKSGTGTNVVSKAEPIASISARIKRVGTDEWIDLGVISGPPTGD